MKGVGRNPKGDGRKKGGLKVHLLPDVQYCRPLVVNLNSSLLTRRVKPTGKTKS
ncbi:MAG: hypothetical protein LBP63_02510 [Prevotellaceae bacterium]|nr:hypothetical protein [Prevotellaceae bacterium]